MVEARAALYRLDFCADLTTAHAPVFNLGYMLESAVAGGARFLGLASRVALTRVELDAVNEATWPELAALDEFMGRLFEDAWSAVEGVDRHDLSLGSDKLATRFSARSAFQFGRLDVATDLLAPLQGADEEVWQQHYYGTLLTFGKKLKPTLTAAILPLVPSIPQAVIEPRPKYRLEAA